MFELPKALSERRGVVAKLYQLDAAAGYVLRPNYDGRLSTLKYDQTFHTNARGLRGPDLGPKAPGEFRLVLLGDSIVFGAMIPEEQLLTRNSKLSCVLVAIHGCAWSMLRYPAGARSTKPLPRSNANWIEPDLGQMRQ